MPDYRFVVNGEVSPITVTGNKRRHALTKFMQQVYGFAVPSAYDLAGALAWLQVQEVPMDVVVEMISGEEIENG